MSDEFEPKPLSGRMKLYAPGTGVLVTLPVPIDGAKFDYAGALAGVNAALAAGWLAHAPGLEAGEQREEIGYVVRRSKDNRDGGVTPVLDLYPANDAAKFAVLTVYLNTSEDVTAFEAASGLKLAGITPYIGDNKIERGKKRELDQLVKKAPRPFGVVLMPNPKYDERAAQAAHDAKEIYPVPRRKFVRWADQKPTAAAPRDDKEFDYLLSGVELAADEPARVAALVEANKAIAAGRLTDAQRARLVSAAEERKRWLAMRAKVPAAADDEEPIPF